MTTATALSNDDLGASGPLSVLDTIRAARMGDAAVRLREVQAWAGAYAAMLEGGACTVADLLNADAAFLASTRRAAEALHIFGAAFDSKGTA